MAVLILMVKLMVRAKVKKTGEFIEHRINIDDEIRKADNDALYGFVSDFLDLKYGDIFMWFRFWTVP